MIDCNDYDYVEIACMHQYPLKITLKAGDVIVCKAIDTQLNSEREECITVDVEGHKTSVVLDNISTLEVTIDNPHFSEVSFD